MKAIIVLACALLLTFTGCMRTYDLTREVPEVPRGELGAQLVGETWRIENLDGTSMMGAISALSQDSISYVQEGVGKLITVPTRNDEVLMIV